MAAILEQWRSLSGVEVVAVLLAVAYLLLLIRQHIACWACAIVSSGIYVGIFVEARLYMEALLYVFYVGMAVYGWWVWAARGPDQHGPDQDKLPVVRWSFKVHIAALLGISVLVLTVGWLLSKTDAAYPYADSATTFAALWATFLVARKVLENWAYWLVIDAASAVIYWQRGLELTTLLYIVYLLFIPFGWWAWTQSFRRQSAVTIDATAVA